MKKILLFLLLPIMIKAQYIHSFEYFGFDYTTNRVEYFPMGNIGFDTKLNPYNPDIIHDSASIFINVSAYTNLSQTIYENDEKRFIEDRKFYPNFIAQYQNDWYAIQLSYVSGMLSSLEGINQNWEFNFYPTVNTDVLFIPTVNTTMQLSSIFHLSDQFSASLGIITNNFETQFVIPDQGYIKYKRSFFDNIQVNAALNFNYDDFIRCYLLVRSESPDKELEIEHSLVSNSNPSLDHPDVFFNGLVSAGIKVNVLENLGLSLESKNDFVNYETVSPYFSPYYSSEESGQFNARIMSGINYKPFDFAQIGILYSTYLNYKNPFHRGYPFDIVTQPYAIILGASVSYVMLDFNLQYQYSGYEIRAQGFNYFEKYKNHYLGFGIDVKL